MCQGTKTVVAVALVHSCSHTKALCDLELGWQTEPGQGGPLLGQFSLGPFCLQHAQQLCQSGSLL